MTEPHKDRLGPWGAAAIFFFGILLFAGGSLYVFERQNNINDRICQVTVDNRASTRAAFDAVRQAFVLSIPVNESPQERAERIARIDAFVDAILRPIPALECVNNQPVPKEG